MDFWINYFYFLLKTFTLLFAFIIAFIAIILSSQKIKGADRNSRIVIRKVNNKFKEYLNTINKKILTKKEFSKINKSQKKSPANTQKKCFIINFNGDLQASGTDNLREEINALMQIKDNISEVIVCLESPGGVVSGYGLAASQLQRLKDINIPITVCVDKVAASGGYMIACIADKIIAAPFSIIGSIGVIAQMPNFNKIMKKNDIDYEMHSAGEFKRTLTMLGENTDEGRKKFKEDLEVIQKHFKSHISKHRKDVDIDKVATGEFWLASDALDLKLIDELKTSDDYIYNKSLNNDIYHIEYKVKPTLKGRLCSLINFVHSYTNKNII